MTIRTTAAELARRLAQNAEAVCRHYLSAGRKHGRYWLVGDASNKPGQSLYVRLAGSDSGKGAAGKWMDASTGEYGDLLDLIRASCQLTSFRDTAEEAQRFLGLPANQNARNSRTAGTIPADAARRLFAMSRPIPGTLAERYLWTRRITGLGGTSCLRFHPSCFYRPDSASPSETWPAMIAAVTGLDGGIHAVHRTWLDPFAIGKAPIATPRHGRSPRSCRPFRRIRRRHGGGRRDRDHPLVAHGSAHDADAGFIVGPASGGDYIPGVTAAALYRP